MFSSIFIGDTKQNILIQTLLNDHSALRWIVNLSFHPVLDNVLISHYLSGLFNLYPKPPTAPRDIWDVNQVLSYWDGLPLSRDLLLMLLSQKTTILILISMMRRRHELYSYAFRSCILLSKQHGVRS